MASDGDHISEPNGSVPSRSEHELLKADVSLIRATQLAHGQQLNFIESQIRLIGQAVELLLREQGDD